jgi:hypothetical protein
MKTNAHSLLLLVSMGLVGASAALPSCGGSGDQKQGAGGNTPDGGSGGSGASDAGDAGDDGSAVFIDPSLCKSVGAANEVAPSDPNAQGQCLFLLDAWGTEVLGEWPPTSFMLSLLQSEPAFFGPQFSSFGFIPDPSDDLPIGFKRGLADATQIHETCAMCHTAKLPDGRIWFGAPNVALDVGRFQVEVDTRWVAAGHPSNLGPLSTTKAKALGPGRFNAESSDYPYLVGADFPPYFTLKDRTHMNYLGTGNNVRTEAYFAIYSFGAGSPNAKTAKVPFPAEARLTAFLGFFGAFDPPAGPAPDATLVAQGQTVFAGAGCGSCHHPQDIGLDPIVTYDKNTSDHEQLPGVDPAFPNGSIQTDIMHRVLIDSTVGPDAGATGDAGADTGYADLINFIIDHGLAVTMSDGYRPSDLRGLWATPPYLHNGSVPTLDALLQPAASRPVTWMRGQFLFDTTVLGNSNQGHEFGTTLSASDRAALVAYLSSL